MALSEAKMLAEGAVCNRWTPEPFRAISELWLQRCSIVSDRIEVEDQHSAWVDLSLHSQPVTIACELKCAIERLLGVKVSIGLGGSKWLAKVAALSMRTRGGPTIADEIDLMEPILRASEFLAPLPTRMLLPIPEDQRQRLLFLGYPTIGEVALLPYELLHTQFGNEAFRIVQAACGGLYEPIQPNYPPECINDRFEFAGTALSLETVDYGLQRIAERIGKLLASKEKQGNDLRLWFDQEDDPTVTLERRFAKPFYDPPTTLTALRLSSTNVGLKSVQRVRVSAPNLSPVLRTQASLESRPKHERIEVAHEALATLRRNFGENSVQLAVARTLSHREQVMRSWKHATGWR